MRFQQLQHDEDLDEQAMAELSEDEQERYMVSQVERQSWASQAQEGLGCISRARGSWAKAVSRGSCV